MSKSLTHWNDDEQPLSQRNFVIQTLRATWDNLPQLLLGMIWLNLCLAPSFVLAVLGFRLLAAVTGVLLAVPGWVALQHVQGQLVQGKAVRYAALLASLRRFWRPSVRMGAMAIALPVVTFLGISVVNDLASGLAAPVLAAGAAASLLAACLLVLYAMPLMVLYEQDLGLALRNSLILSARYITNTIGMVALAVICGLLVGYLNSGLIFVLPALYGMFVVNNCRLVMGLEETV